MKPPTGDPDPTLFEMGAIAVQLKFHYDALLFMERVKAATQSCRYKVRQFAKRRHDGTIPIAGFSALLCKTSEGDYAKTLARLIFFIVQKQPVMSKRVSDSLDAGHSPSHIERMTAIQDLLFEALCEGGNGHGFLLELFIELYYAVAPNGPINRSAEFVQHAAVHIIYAMRGLFLLKCAENVIQGFDAGLQERWSMLYLNEQKDNAFSSVQSLKRVAAFNIEEFDCKIVWLDQEALEVQTTRGNVPISMSDLRSMYDGFIRRIEVLMCKMKIPVMSKEELAAAVDVKSSIQGEGIMSMNRVLLSSRLNPASAANGGAVSDEFKKDFCTQSYELGKLLTLALYLSGGPAARMTEISNWRVSNSSESSMRNVRFLRNLIGVVNSYSKAESYGGAQADGNIVCFADLKLSALVMTYLIHVKRLEHEYVGIYGGTQEQMNSLMHFLVNKGKMVNGVTLGKIFRHEFLGHGLDVSIADMRHVLEAFARKIGCLLVESQPNPLLRMANHSDCVSNARYGRSSHDLPGVPADRMDQCFKYCTHWNRVILNSEMSEHSLLSQAGDMPSSGELCGSVVAVPAHPMTPLKVVEHSNLHVDTFQSQSIEAATQLATRGHHTLPNIRVTKRVRDISVEQALHMLGMKSMKQMQQRAFEFLQEHQNVHSLIILPTGTGKSKLVYLDAITRHVCNVLFVPFRAIYLGVMSEGDHTEDLKIVSWASIRHDFDSAANSAHVVVASFEHAGTGMISFLQQLQKLDRLGHCFVDEADVLLESYRNFKDFWMLPAACPLVKLKAMTATLRPCHRTLLSRMAGVDMESCPVLREPCMRDDIELRCRYYRTDCAVLAGLQAWLLALPKDSARIIIFVMTIREAEALGALLEVMFPGEVSVSHSLRRDSLARVAVVTSCFGHGINIVGLSHVAIVRCCWSCEGLVQAMGRLRQPGICTIFTTIASLLNIVGGSYPEYSMQAKETAQLLIDNRNPADLKAALSKLLDTSETASHVGVHAGSDAVVGMPTPQFSSVCFNDFQYFCQSIQMHIAELATQKQCMYCLILNYADAGQHKNQDCPKTKGMCNRCFTPGHNR